MKALYIHGLDSFPVPEKLDILRQQNMEVVALHLDYRNQPDAYQILKDKCIYEKVEFLVGSSLGGYIAYWLGEDLGLPGLLFNPAMSFHHVFKHNLPDIQQGKATARFVVIGNQDKTVDPVANLEFLRENGHNDCYQRVLICDWLGHQVDFVSFQDLTVWALNSYRQHFR